VFGQDDDVQAAWFLSSLGKIPQAVHLLGERTGPRVQWRPQHEQGFRSRSALICTRGACALQL